MTLPAIAPPGQVRPRHRQIRSSVMSSASMSTSVGNPRTPTARAPGRNRRGRRRTSRSRGARSGASGWDRTSDPPCRLRPVPCVPPRRSWWKPVSMAAFFPEHSSTTWATCRDPFGLPRWERLDLGWDREPWSAPSSAASSWRSFPRLDDGDRSHARGQPVPRPPALRWGRRPITMTLSPGRDSRPGDAVQRHRQRLGQGACARGHPGGRRSERPPRRTTTYRAKAPSCGRRRSNPAGSRTATACPRGSADNVRTSGWCPPTTVSPTSHRSPPHPARRWNR